MLYKGISMASKLITTHELTGTRVLGGKKGTKRIGKIRRFVFHPKEKRVIGFVVKRPDLLWMFHRADVFVPIDGYDLVDGRVIIRPDAAATGEIMFDLVKELATEERLTITQPLSGAGT